MTQAEGEFRPRAFQRRMLETALNKYERGEKVMVVDAHPGSGKTSGYLVIASEFLNRGFVQQVQAFAPRLNLCGQAEDDARELRKLLPGMAAYPLPHRGNNPPLIRGDAPGYVSTYASLVNGEDSYTGGNLHVAITSSKATLLILDEAQILGCADPAKPWWTTQMATKSALVVRELISHAEFVVVLTGTPNRADRKPILPEFVGYSEADEDGYRYLQADVSSGYSEGIRESYLKPMSATLKDANLIIEYVDRTEALVISEVEKKLYDSLLDRRFWQAVVDEVVGKVRAKQIAIDPEECGLVACANQDQAEQVEKYISRKYEGIKTLIAISRDEEVAHDNLRHFRNGAYDLLISVRMAYVGYDHKPISTVGVLTHYRDPGHLRQLVFRGGRARADVPFEKQLLDIVAPDDPKMVQFIDVLRAETELGLKEWKPGSERTREVTPEFGEITDLKVTGSHAMGMNPVGDLHPHEYPVWERLAQENHVGPASLPGIAAIVRLSGGNVQAELRSPSGATVVEDPESSLRAEEREQLLRREIRSINNSLAGLLLKAGLLPHTDEGKPKWGYPTWRCNEWFRSIDGKEGMPQRSEHELKACKEFMDGSLRQEFEEWVEVSGETHGH